MLKTHKQSILLGIAACAAMLVGAVAEAQGNRAEYGYQTEECPFNAPAESLVVCGGITIPENHETKTGKVYLPIVRIMHETIRAETPAAILGGGGPGGGLSLHDEEAIAGHNDFRKELLGDGGELILIDARSSGGAYPLLNCPDVEDATRRTIHLPLDGEVELDYFQEIFLDCVRWWGKRVDLSSYTTDAMVEDMELVRRALDVKQWDVIGSSYGTRLVLELIRRYPDNIRAAVLDSPVPADSDTLPPRIPYETVLNRVAEDCSRDAQCKRYGNLRENLDRATELIHEKRPPVTLVYPEVSFTVALTPVRFSEMVFFAAYNDEYTKQLPLLAHELASGKWHAPVVSVFAESYLDEWLFSSEFAWPLLNVVTCREGIITDSGESDGHVFPGQIYPGEDGDRIARRNCRHFNDIVGTTRPFIRPPVTSDKPMIIIAGEYDIATPVEHARVLANRLPNARLMVIPRGHSPLQHTPCALEVTRRFLESPNAPMSRHCAVPPLEFD